MQTQSCRSGLFRGVQETAAGSFPFGIRDFTPDQIQCATDLSNVNIVGNLKIYTCEQSSSSSTALPAVHNPDGFDTNNVSLGPDLKKSTQPKKTQFTQNDGNWEISALAGIRKKGLSLNCQWSEKSWSNKSSMKERLKLLKDAGVDLVLLQDMKLSSKEITQAVIAQAIVHQRSRQNLKSNSTEQQYPLDSPCQTDDGGCPQQPSDDSISQHLRYQPRASPPTKRKRTYTLDTTSTEIYLPYVLEHDMAPEYKRRCARVVGTSGGNRGAAVEYSTLPDADQDQDLTTEDEIKTWDELKFNILGCLSQPAHIARFATPSQVVKPFSRIIVTFPDQVSQIDMPGEFELGSKSYDMIMRELRTLSTSQDSDGTFLLARLSTTQYDTAVKAKYTTTSAIANDNQVIRVIVTTPHRTIIEGHTLTLMRFVARLKGGRGLVSFAKNMDFDASGRRVKTGVPYELSNKTQAVLGKIEDALALYSKDGATATIFVRWVYDGVTPKYPQAGV